MANEYDLVIRNGSIADGNGGAPFEGDVAVKDGLIAAIGKVAGSGMEEIDASGRLVTPGFIDIHTHYDGQVTWEETLNPSSNHGVTTVVMGNCGVGFAPCRPGDRDTLIRFMEGVEDIPEVVMADGIPWNWESFPEYLNALDKRAYDMDIVAQLPHSALRVFVMGERGAQREPATQAELAEMRRLTAEAVSAGALGVSTSRMHYHRALNGDLAPSIEAPDEELLALAGGLADAGRGVFQMITDIDRTPEQEFALMRQLTKASGRPLSFSLVQQSRDPDAWRSFLDLLEDANEEGLPIRGQVFPRPIAMMQGLEMSMNPFMQRPSYLAIAHLPLAERVAIMRDPAFRAKLLAETSQPHPYAMIDLLTTEVADVYPLSDPPNYTPDISDSIGHRAAVMGVTPHELAYDLLLEDDGHAVLFRPATNFHENKIDAQQALVRHPRTMIGLADGGAHYGLVCDAGYPTYMLAQWCRDAAPEDRLSVGETVHLMTGVPARVLGFADRGRVAVGAKADLNIIDMDKVAFHRPRIVYDLPTGGRRMVQDSDGYDATIVSGVITQRDGHPTGARPGRLVRNAGIAN